MKLKEELYRHCTAQLQARRATVVSAIASVEESMRHEGKSTAGDKHNTARASMQLERERLGISLKQIELLESQLKRISVAASKHVVSLGSVVQTTAGLFYLAIPCDAFQDQDQQVYCMGPESPLGQALMGKKKGQAYKINGRSFQILEVD